MIHLIAGLLSLVSFVCWILVLIDAFRAAVWKGVLALFCGIYWIIYALFEYEHEYKWAIVLLGLLGASAAAAMLRSLS